MLDVSLRNRSPQPIATSAPWPSMLTYRWIDARTGDVIVEHGFRTILQPPAWAGTRSAYPMRAIAPNQAGDCILRVTVIQEGWRWLDALEPHVYADTRVSVVPAPGG